MTKDLESPEMQQDRITCYENVRYQAARKHELIKEFIQAQSRSGRWHLLGLGTSIQIASIKKRVPKGIAAIYNKSIPLAITSLVEEFLNETSVARNQDTDDLLSVFLLSLLKSIPENTPLSYFPSTFAKKSNALKSRTTLAKKFHSFKRYEQTALAYIKIAYLCTLDNDPVIDAMNVSRLSRLELPPLSYFSETSKSRSLVVKNHPSLQSLINEAVMTSDPKSAMSVLWKLGEQNLIDQPGHPKDEAKAFQYYLRAEQLGCAQARPVLNRLAKNSQALKNKLSNAKGQSFFRKKAIPLRSEEPSPLNERSSSCETSMKR